MPMCAPPFVFVTASISTTLNKGKFTEHKIKDAVIALSCCYTLAQEEYLCDFLLFQLDHLHLRQLEVSLYVFALDLLLVILKIQERYIIIWIIGAQSVSETYQKRITPRGHKILILLLFLFENNYR